MKIVVSFVWLCRCAEGADRHHRITSTIDESTPKCCHCSDVLVSSFPLQTIAASYESQCPIVSVAHWFSETIEKDMVFLPESLFLKRRVSLATLQMIGCL